MNIMLDIETLGNNSHSAIVAIGAVAFNHETLIDEFYIEINLVDAMKYGKVDGDTILWWMNQSDEARELFKNNNKASTLFNALIEFASWYKKIHGEKVWGNGASFDNVILGNAYRALELPIPWKFYNEMCYRTVKNMNRHIKLERVGVHHNAVDDAKSQALHLLEIMNGPLEKEEEKH